MSNPKKKPGAGFWLATAIAVLLVYVLSLGPAAWLNNRLGPGPFDSAMSVFYAPLHAAYRNGPQFFRDSVDWYLRLWGWYK